MGYGDLTQWFAAQVSVGAGWLVMAAVILLVARGRRWLGWLRSLPALSTTPLAARALAPWVRARAYGLEEFLAADGADARWAAQRRRQY